MLLIEKANIRAGVTSVEMDLKDINIKDFIFEEKIQFKTIYSNYNIYLVQLLVTLSRPSVIQGLSRC